MPDTYDSPADLAQLRRVRWAVRLALLLGVAASIAANVLHAQPNIISQVISAWPPLALLLTVELVSRVPVHRRHLAVLRVVATIVISGIAAWVSYWHMAGVAGRYGETDASPYLLPVSVDGLIGVASISLVELAGRIRAAEAAIRAVRARDVAEDRARQEADRALEAERAARAQQETMDRALEARARQEADRALEEADRASRAQDRAIEPRAVAKTARSDRAVAATPARARTARSTARDNWWTTARDEFYRAVYAARLDESGAEVAGAELAEGLGGIDPGNARNARAKYLHARYADEVARGDRAPRDGVVLPAAIQSRIAERAARGMTGELRQIGTQQ